MSSPVELYYVVSSVTFDKVGENRHEVTKKNRQKRKKLNSESDSLVERNWSNLKGPGGFSSLTAFAKSRKNADNLRQLERSLSKIEAFSRHRGRHKKKSRPAVIVHKMNYLFCTDLIMMHNKKQNKGYAYICVTQDIFSKK